MEKCGDEGGWKATVTVTMTVTVTGGDDRHSSHQLLLPLIFFS